MKTIPLLVGVIAAIIYSFGGAAAADANFNPWAAFPISEAFQGLGMLVIVLTLRLPLFPISFRKCLSLAFFFGSSHLLFLVSLQLAPVGPAVAIHMAAPLVLMVWQLFKKERDFGREEAAVSLLLVLGILMAVPKTGGGDDPLLGLLLAIISVPPFAIAMHLITEWGRDRDLRAAAVWRSLLIFLVSWPLILTSPPSLEWAGWYAILGIITAPATLMVWWVASKVAVTVTTSLQLSEAFWAAAFAALFFDKPMSWLQALATILILLAVWIEFKAHQRDTLPIVSPQAPESAS